MAEAKEKKTQTNKVITKPQAETTIKPQAKTTISNLRLKL